MGAFAKGLSMVFSFWILVEIQQENIHVLGGHSPRVHIFTCPIASTKWRLVDKPLNC